jgi:hypothetical protein
VIRVRRRDFVSGSHNVTGFQGIAERFPRGVTIYLLPGLTGRQRRAVIRRLRQEASRGFGPELPLPQLVIALFLDRVRGAIGLALAAVRFHPGVTLLPAAFVAAVMTLFVLTSAGVEAVGVARPALVAEQSGTGLRSAAGTDVGGLVAMGGGSKGATAGGLVAVGGGSKGATAGGLVAVGGGSKAATAGVTGAGTGAGRIRPSSTGAGGRGLGSGQPAPTTGPRSTARPRAARVCFGAMQGMAATGSPLACHRTSS